MGLGGGGVLGFWGFRLKGHNGFGFHGLPGLGLGCFGGLMGLVGLLWVFAEF